MAAGGKKPEKSPRKKKAAKPKGWKAPPGRCGATLKSLRCEVKRSPCGRSISELVSRLSPGHMSAKAKRLMDSSMCILCKGVVTEADRHRRRRRGSFIGTSEVQAALEKVMKGKGSVYVASAVRGRSS